MAPRTRSKPSAKGTETKSDDAPATLPQNDTNPPKLFILPKNTSPDARIITLPNPATSTPSRYYFCPEQGVYEFTRIAAPKSTPRSWLITPHRRPSQKNVIEKESHNTGEGEEKGNIGANDEDGAEREESSLSTGYVTSHANLMVATPIDPIFLLLPTLAPSSKREKQLFQSLDDHLDTLHTKSSHLRHVLQGKLKSKLESRMSSVCDMVDAGDEKMYRLSTGKLVQELLSKAKRMAQKGLPASLEEHFVRKALEVPIMGIKCEDTGLNIMDTENVAPPEEGDSQSTVKTTTPSHSMSEESQGSVITAATSVSEEQPPPKPTTSAPECIADLLRIRTALDFICSSYLPPILRSLIQESLKSNSTISFAPLDAHLEHLASRRKEAQALRSLSDNISRKRAVEDDEEAAEARAEKKRRKEEEEVKKKNLSRGVKALEKVNTKGMKKLSSFFTSKPQTKKA